MFGYQGILHEPVTTKHCATCNGPLIQKWIFIETGNSFRSSSVYQHKLRDCVIELAEQVAKLEAKGKK